MNKKEAFQIVLTELTKNNLFKGIYDAKNGNENFMYGICTVMEAIAYSIDDKTGDSFSELFMNNIIKSEERR